MNRSSKTPDLVLVHNSFLRRRVLKMVVLRDKQCDAKVINLIHFYESKNFRVVTITWFGLCFKNWTNEIVRFGASCQQTAYKVFNVIHKGMQGVDQNKCEVTPILMEKKVAFCRKLFIEAFRLRTILLSMHYIQGCINSFPKLPGGPASRTGA